MTISPPEFMLTFFFYILLPNQVEELDEKLPPAPADFSKRKDDQQDEAASLEDDDDADADMPIATWTYCTVCQKNVTKLCYISDDCWKVSGSRGSNVAVLCCSPNPSNYCLSRYIKNVRIGSTHSANSWKRFFIIETQ